MTPLFAMALAGLTAGLVHALSGPDHLAAVAPLALAGGRRWRAGLLWGAGHSAGVAAVGLAALGLRGLLPLDRFSSWGERMVGVALVAVGVWGLGKAWRRSRAVAPPPRAGGAAFSVGALHGFAGSSHLLGLLPALALPSFPGAGAYVAGFALGTIGAMAAFSSLLGAVAARTGTRGAATHPLLLAGSSAGALVVGGWWLVA